MRALLLNVVIALGVGCVRTPKLVPEPSLNEVYLARSIQFAMRVVGPATAYDVVPPAGLGRVRDLAAQYSGLVVASSLNTGNLVFAH